MFTVLQLKTATKKKKVKRLRLKKTVLQKEEKSKKNIGYVDNWTLKKVNEQKN